MTVQFDLEQLERRAREAYAPGEVWTCAWCGQSNSHHPDCSWEFYMARTGGPVALARPDPVTSVIRGNVERIREQHARIGELERQLADLRARVKRYLEVSGDMGDCPACGAVRGGDAKSPHRADCDMFTPDGEVK